MDAILGTLSRACNGQPGLEQVLLGVFKESRHTLSIRTSLLNPKRSATCLTELEAICSFRNISQEEFESVVRRTSTLRSNLFLEQVATLPIAENIQRFNQEFEKNHPIIAHMGPSPSDEQRLALESFVDAMRTNIMINLRGLLKQVAGEPGHDGYPLVSTRAKDAAGIIDKISRMRTGNERKGPRPEYTFGDMPDGLGGRITVTLTTETPSELEVLSTRFEEVYRDGILERDSFYSNPTKRWHPYRVIAYTVGIDGVRAEIQLTSLAASLSADLGHNTLHKPLLPLQLGQAEEIMLFWRKATVRELEMFERSSDQRAP